MDMDMDMDMDMVRMVHIHMHMRCTCLQKEEEADERQPGTHRIEDIVHHEHLTWKVCRHSISCALAKARTGVNKGACQGGGRQQRASSCTHQGTNGCGAKKEAL